MEEYDSRRFSPPKVEKKTKSIAELVAFAKKYVTEHDEISLGMVPNHLAQRINAKTGVCVLNSIKKLNASGIRHAFNGHGDCIKELERGQICITDKDFGLLTEILNNPDDYLTGTHNRKGQGAVVFVKRIKGQIYNVVMSVVKSKFSIDLTFNTMYIKKEADRN